MGSRFIYKLDIFKQILEKEIDDLTVIEMSLSDYISFDLGDNNANLHVASLCELENQNEALQRSGFSDLLACVVFDSAALKVFDTDDGGLIKELNELPEPFTPEHLTHCEVMQAKVMGD